LLVESYCFDETKIIRPFSDCFDSFEAKFEFLKSQPRTGGDTCIPPSHLNQILKLCKTGFCETFF
jgi:hypothetical protein